MSCLASGECSLNINAGGAAIPGWDKDEDDSGPSYAYATKAPISTTGVASPAPQAVYQSQRVATGGVLKYTLAYGSAPLGKFQVALHFAELYFAAAGKRVFNVSINGTPVLSNFDVEAAAGGKLHALVKTFSGSTTTNSIVVEFTSVTNYPVINGLQIAWGLPASPTYESLYSFKGGADGANPGAGLIDVGGVLYGTTVNGGAGAIQGNYGTVYAITPSGAERVVFAFYTNPDIYDGGHPEAGLIDVNGTLYGTGYDLGGVGQGTVFKVSPSGTESVIYNFAAGSDGANPAAGLIDVNGVLYGTTSNESPDAGASGTVFAVTTSGTERVVYSFGYGTDGQYPYAGLIDVNGNLYGTTLEGGASGNGTVFEVTTSGTERVLYSFKAGTDGQWPFAGLIEVNGTLYGTTAYGGTAASGAAGTVSGKGTVFALTTSGAERVLYRFKGGNDGADPQAGLLDVNGVLYGTTAQGGPSGKGTIFEMSTSGAERVLYSFKGGTDGAYPQAGLIDVNGVLYGTTAAGGASGNGTVFKLTL